MDKNDTPIIEQDYILGVKIVDIGDYRVSRGYSRRASSSCKHYRLVYDSNERRIWCKDCETDVDAFDAFKGITEHFSSQNRKLEMRETNLKEAENYNLISLAAKAIDEAWRKKNMIPNCPHCKKGLMPEDFKHGIRSYVSKEYELARRKATHPNQ